MSYDSVSEVVPGTRQPGSNRKLIITSVIFYAILLGLLYGLSFIINDAVAGLIIGGIVFIGGIAVISIVMSLWKKNPGVQIADAELNFKKAFRVAWILSIVGIVVTILSVASSLLRDYREGYLEPWRSLGIIVYTWLEILVVAFVISWLTLVVLKKFKKI